MFVFNQLTTMGKIKKAFIYALIVTVVINGFGFLINGGLITNFDEAIKDILHIGPISFSLFFVPCLLSALYYQNTIFKNLKSTLSLMIKPMIFSFVIVYLLVFLYLNLERSYSVPFFYRTLFPNATFAVLICVFSMLILFLFNKKNNQKSKKLKIKPFKILLIWLLITIIFLVLQILFGHGISLENVSVLYITVFGMIVALLTYVTININEKINKPILLFSFLYVFNSIGVLLIFMLSVAEISKYDTKNLISLFFQGIVVFSPYLLLITLAIHAYYIYLKNKSEKLNLKQIGVEASLKYQQLKSQISPHFLFNNISVLTSLIEENQEKAVKFSEDLSKVYRYFLDQETQDLVTLKDEISFANKYIALLKVRFENALVFKIKVEETDAYYILPMALQQVFENVVKHNELIIENPITITLIIENGFMVISNTLHPKLSIKTSNPTGLENIKNRYAYFTDEKVIINKENNLFTIKLPLLKSEV